MGTMMGIRYGEEKWSIESASKSIAAFVQKRDEEKRKAILDYFTIMIIEKEDQIDALLKEINPPIAHNLSVSCNLLTNIATTLIGPF